MARKDRWRWLKSFSRPTTFADGRKPARRPKLSLELLEDRVVPAAGTLDPSFGIGGLVTTNFSQGSNPSYDAASAVAADGKIVVAGYSYGSSGGANVDFAVARDNADGSLDTSFGTGGKMTIDFGSPTDFATAVAVQADGSVVVAGYTANSAGSGFDFAVARLTSAGQLDTTFDGDGK